jgi:cell fate regulator YaaT (PSP1 superfamily)
MYPETQKMRKQRGRSVEDVKYEWEWYNDPSRKLGKMYNFEVNVL